MIRKHVFVAETSISGQGGACGERERAWVAWTPFRPFLAGESQGSPVRPPRESVGSRRESGEMHHVLAQATSHPWKDLRTSETLPIIAIGIWQGGQTPRAVLASNDESPPAGG